MAYQAHTSSLVEIRLAEASTVFIDEFSLIKGARK